LTKNSFSPVRFKEALARFDQANGDDPNFELIEGIPQPKELVYARRMTEWLDQLDPEAGEALRLSVRCQHIRRWVIPRSEFPSGRVGYRRWRTTLADYHAQTAATILREVDYDGKMVARVEELLRKQHIKSDPDTQTLEDVACLVFIQYYLSSFAAQHEEPKLLEILRKTWRKMSDRGHMLALEIDLDQNIRILVEKALA
jgi:hypothetical protein